MSTYPKIDCGGEWPPPEIFTEGFKASLKKYFNDEALSDAVIRCEGSEFKVHRLVLSCHSEYFAKQLSGPWKACQESTERAIDIADFDPTVVEAMLRFMYQFEYTNGSGVSEMVFDAQVYQIADKYGVSALKEFAKLKFGDAIEAGWKMDDFPVAINVVYTTTPSDDRGLRDLTVETSHKNLDILTRRDCFCQILRETPDFAADLVPFICGRSAADMKSYKCPSCNQIFNFDDPGSSTRYCPRCQYGCSSWKNCVFKA
ncbi:Protein roadkill [Fusarium austroafricanum]|uniref:Protein roadkill n=1 Tax=Fusarium austroafricanum TaxID=2364996 RepID=A0A8H4KNT7_9HYPO|nr:Protein roadkill [Fusarium austroafricanum]